MNFFLSFFKKFKTDIDFSVVKRLLYAIFILILSSAYLVYYLEPREEYAGYFDALWWAIVTSTTVGYGDTFPTTVAGKVVAIILMIFGIGLLGALAAKTADLIITLRKRKEKGLLKSNFENHIIICGWCKKTKDIIEKLNSVDKKKDIVLVADKNVNPLEEKYEDVLFVSGKVEDRNTLIKAGVKKASVAIILNTDNNDATTVLSALNVEAINNDIYSIAELSDKDNKVHMENADVDEIIVNNDISTKMLIRSAVYNGISGIIDELIDNEYGTEIYYKKPEKKDLDNNYIDILKKYKEDHDFNIIGIKRDNDILLNPNKEEKIINDDELIYLGVNNY